jgi:hypothetical protein
MNTMTIARAVVTGVVLVLGTAAHVEAQAGLLRRAQEKAVRAVEEAIGGAPVDESPASAAATPSTGGSSTARAPSSSADRPPVLAIDAEVMARFTRALAAEIEARDEWTRFEENFSRCQMAMYTTSPGMDEMMRLTEQMGTAMENARTTDDLIRVSQDHQERMDALLTKHCGTSHTEFARRQTRASDTIMDTALTAGDFGSVQYAILKERVVPFCMSGGSSDRIAGPEGKHFYVYSADEVSTLAPRCTSLLPEVERTL